MTAPPPLAVSDIEAMLSRRVETLCWELFPNGHVEGGRTEFRIGSLAGEKGQSLGVRLRDGRVPAGTWKDFSGGAVQGRDQGDCLWLVACALFGGELAKAVAWSKSWLQIDDLDPARIERHRLEAQAARAASEREADQAVARTRASARKRWHMGVPIGGTIVETYLAGRGIDLRALGKQPGALRFNPSVQCGYGDSAVLLPAMLAQVNALVGEHIATHRTWLKGDGSGKADAADGLHGKSKKVLGLYRGGHIPLWKGACGSMPLRDIPAGTDVWCSEGIEDGLTAACADPSLRVVAGISVGNFADLELPEQMGWLIFLAQNDAPGSDADKALSRAIAAHRARGRRVKVARPPRSAGKDINELAQLALEAAA
jgi:hypothetical protein